MASLWIETGKITLNKTRDPLTVTVDCIGYDGKFGGNGREIDGRHTGTLRAEFMVDLTPVVESWVFPYAAYRT